MCVSMDRQLSISLASVVTVVWCGRFHRDSAGIRSRGASILPVLTLAFYCCPHKMAWLSRATTPFVSPRASMALTSPTLLPPPFRLAPAIIIRDSI